MSEIRAQLAQGQRWIVKLGSALLTADGAGLNTQDLEQWVAQIADLVKQGKEVVLVSSGAVAVGVQRLGWPQRPQEVSLLQAAAAVGQMGLIQHYQSVFQRYGLHTAQVLLTHDDLSDRKRYLNARSTLNALLQHGVIPIVNENDTVVTDEIRFGDNDTLAALVANLIEADNLVLLTDQQGLYTANPRQQPDAQLITERSANDASLDSMVGEGGALGRGGMITKLRAARLAARSGAHTLIAHGRTPQVLPRLLAGEVLGTLLSSEQARLAARKQWLAGHLQMRGQLVLDAGAVRVLRLSGSSLLAAGVVAVQGDFVRGEMVACVDQAGQEVARGLVNYTAEEADKIKGLSSEAFVQVLGYMDDVALIHRDNLVVSAR